MVTTSGENDRYLPHVDGLRALAVLVVVLFHVHVPGFGGGFVGVDVFLVISGFLITRLITRELTETGSFRFGRFYLRRIRRLGPALLVTSAVVLVAAAILQSPGVLERTGAELVASTLSVSNFYFWLNADYFAVDQWTRPMLHTWSLSLEEQFYLVWPLTLLVAARCGGRRAVVVAVAALTAASLALNPLFADGAPAWARSWLPEVAQDGKPTLFFMLPFRVFEFAIGGLLSMCGTSTTSTGRGAALGFGGLLMILASALTYDERMVFPSWAGLLPCLGTALAIHHGHQGLCGRLLANRIATWIGRISYSVYLVHWPIIALHYYVAGRPDAFAQTWIVGGSLLLGHLSWRFVETPFRHKRIPLWSLLPLVGTLVAVAIYCQRSGGWPARFEPAFVTHGVANSSEFHRQEYGGYGFKRGPLVTGKQPDFLLIGDSHGKQLTEGLVRELLEPGHLGGSMEAGTSLLHTPGIVRTTAGQDWQKLLDSQLETIERVLRTTQPQPVVLLGQSWIGQAARSAPRSPSGELLDAPVTPELVVAGLVELRRRLGIRQLVVVGQVPPPQHADLFEELSRPPLSRRVDPQAARTFAPPEAAAAWNRALAAGAAQTGAYTFLDPTEALTVDGRCLAITADDELIYTDSTHLSRTGSRLVMRHFRDRLLALLASR